MKKGSPKTENPIHHRVFPITTNHKPITYIVIHPFTKIIYNFKKILNFKEKRMSYNSSFIPIHFFKENRYFFYYIRIRLMCNFIPS